MLSDLNNFVAVLVVIGMAWFIGWLILDDRKSRKAGKHEYFLHNDEEDWA